MCADNFKKSGKYTDTRDNFDDLGVEEQAVFIVESAVNMIVKSVRKAGDAFSKAFDDIRVDAEDEAEAEAPEEKKTKASGAKAKTTKKAAPKSAKKKTAPKSKSDK